MEQQNEVPVEKIADLEAQIQRKNKERIEMRGKMTQFQTQKQQFEAKFQTEKQQLESEFQARKRQLDAKFQPQKQHLEAMNDVLKSENNVLEMDTAKLVAELKAIKIQSRANHCDRHPRMLAGLRVDCEGGGHLLCVGCIRHWSTDLTAGQCPFCGKPIKGGGIEAKQLEQLVDKLVADERMMRPDTSLPLPFELNAEIWEFAKKNRFILYGKNRWGSGAGSFAGELNFLTDGLSVSKENNRPFWSTVRAVKPFSVLKSALIDYCVPHTFYFEVLLKKGYIFIGLSGPDFPLTADDTWVGSEPGSYSLNTLAEYNAGPNVRHNLQPENGWYAILNGDVAGCGLLVSPNDHRHRLFFTKNGRLFGKSVLLPAMDANNQVLFPTVTLLKTSLTTDNTSIEANFGDDPEKEFCYKFGRRTSCNDLLQTWISRFFRLLFFFRN